MSITLSLKNCQKLTSVHTNKYSVQHKNKKYALAASDQFKVKIAAAAGILLFGVGTFFTERLALNYYRNQLKDQLRSRDEARYRKNFYKQSDKMRDRADALVEERAKEFQLKRLPAKKERYAFPIHELSMRRQYCSYNFYFKKRDEILLPTVRVALWRRAYLYR